MGISKQAWAPYNSINRKIVGALIMIWGIYSLATLKKK